MRVSDNNKYREVLGSDVVNDGMYLELRNDEENVVAIVFRSDGSGEFEVHVGSIAAPPEVIDEFVKRAKSYLEERAKCV